MSISLRHFKTWGLFAASIFFLLLAGCATHQSRLDGPRLMLKSQQYEQALGELQKLSVEKNGDELLNLMEYGTALRIAGEYKDSNAIFMRADKLADEVDYQSISRNIIATLGSEEMIQYKGESYENLLINAYLAMNFMMLGEKDSALVEVRRINDKINRIRNNGREDYEYSPFAIYLSALIYESNKQYDDAYISYSKTYELDPTIPALPEDLIRSSRLARRTDTWKKWKQQFPDVKDPSEGVDPRWGELIVIYEQGWGPRKAFSQMDVRYPTLIPSYSQTRGVEVTLQAVRGLKGENFGRIGQDYKNDSAIVYDLERAAIATLNADYSWMVARKVGAFVAKKVVADQIRQKNEALGLLADIAMQASDRADLRNWSLLPSTIQVARIAVPPGYYKLNLQGLDDSGQATIDRKEEPEIMIRGGQKVFYAWRSLR
jgi:hypothetical protein